MPDQLKHPSHLLVASLVQQHFVPCVGLSLVQLHDLCRRSARAVFQRDAAPQSFDATVRWHALNFDFINFLDTVTRRSYIIREVAVVC